MSYVLTGRGLGDAQSSAQVIQVGGGAAAVGVSAALVAAHMTALVPIVGPAIAAATLIALKLAQGCGQTCIVSSKYANDVEDAMKANIAAYFALAAPRPQTARTLCLDNFDKLWASLKTFCSQPDLKAAGQRCISDRQAGACIWHQNHAPDYPGQPEVGACWNWVNAYRDPIAADASVVPDSAAAAPGGGLFSAFTGEAGGLPWGLLLGGGLLAWAAFKS